MRDFKTVFFRILFVIVIVLCVWQCNAHKNGKTAGVTSASSKKTTTTTTIMAATTTTVVVSSEIVSTDMSADLTSD
ncbi:MAG: hypothetical protein J6Y01_04080 [Spirochaetales bacterium]|nr:hypothetical protein [Spirochaetales bacterium]